MSQISKLKRQTVVDVMQAKGQRKLVCLTAYTAPMAEQLDPHCDVMLVGDSVGMVLHGLADTVGVSLEMMILHGQAVMRKSRQALVVVDLPFGSYEGGPEVAYASAVRVMKETGCQAVKLECTPHLVDTVRFLVDRGVPVMGHIGLLPQSVNVAGGYRVVGKNDEQAKELSDLSKQVADAGAFSVVIEGVVETVAADISASVSVPTIGIGASAQCDGQILVTEDMLGCFKKTPTFVRRYAEMGDDIAVAVRKYAEDVRSGAFPGEMETYSLNK